MASLQTQLDGTCQAIQHEIGVGKVANYIPALAQVPPDKFGAAIVTVTGEKAWVGDAQESFSIQSISKLFALTAVLNRLDKKIWDRVGREPSGNAFNSIVQLELENGIPRNPFINAGALVVTDALLGNQTTEDCTARLLALVQTLADDNSIAIDPLVAQSERATAYRNASLAHFMQSFGNLERPVNDVLDVYCQQCAIAMSCEQLARSALYLASNGTDPLTGEHIVDEERARRINAMMMLCGHYDASGDFAYRVGLPRQKRSRWRDYSGSSGYCCRCRVVTVPKCQWQFTCGNRSIGGAGQSHKMECTVVATHSTLMANPKPILNTSSSTSKGKELAPGYARAACHCKSTVS